MTGLGFPAPGPMAKDQSGFPMGERVLLGQQALYALPDSDHYSFGPSQGDGFRTGDHISDTILVAGLWYGATAKEMADRGLIASDWSSRLDRNVWRVTRDGMAWMASKSGRPMQEPPGVEVALFPWLASEEDKEFFAYAYDQWGDLVQDELADLNVGGVGIEEVADLAKWGLIAAVGFFGLKALRILK